MSALGDVYFRLGIFARDNWTCRYCGYVWPESAHCHPLPWKRLGVRRITLDHVIPRSRGGRNTKENLVTCCVDCNRRRGAIGPELDMLQRALTRLVGHATVPADVGDASEVHLVCAAGDLRDALFALKVVTERIGNPLEAA